MTSTKRIVLCVVLAFLAAIGGVFVGRALLPQPKQPGAALHEVLHHKLALDADQQAKLKVLEDRFAVQRRALELELRATNWPEIQRICDKYGILLVSDEVITGFGRTGQWFGCETMGTRPDLMTFAKGVTSGYIPLGGVMVGERIARVLIDQGGEFNHGYTYSGHPVACAVALANIRLIRREGLVERVREDVGPYLAERYAELAEHPLVGEAQTCGLMAALQLVKRKDEGLPFPDWQEVGMVCRGHCFGNGLIMRAVGDRMIIAPPLVITRAQIDEMVALIRRCLDLTLADLTERGWV